MGTLGASMLHFCSLCPPPWLYLRDSSLFWPLGPQVHVLCSLVLLYWMLCLVFEFGCYSLVWFVCSLYPFLDSFVLFLAFHGSFSSFVYRFMFDLFIFYFFWIVLVLVGFISDSCQSLLLLVISSLLLFGICLLTESVVIGSWIFRYLSG